MCGIFALISPAGGATGAHEDLINSAEIYLERRGPDSLQTRSFTIPCVPNAINITMAASVLHIRGQDTVSQPLLDEYGNCLIWNGEVFGGLAVNGCDTEVVFRELVAACESASTDDAILRVLGQIEGPFALCFYEAARKRVWFGRDPLGRRSLLIRRDCKLGLAICSVALNSCDANAPACPECLSLSPAEWHEAPSTALSMLDLCDRIASSFVHKSLQAFPWLHGKEMPGVPQFNISSRLPSSEDLPDPQAVTHFITSTSSDAPSLLIPLLTYADTFLSVLSDAVCARVSTIDRAATDLNAARIAVMFSGGIDCSVVAALAGRHVAPNEPIDLLNVAFENPNKPTAGMLSKWDVPDRLAGRSSYRELCRLFPNRRWNFVEVNVVLDEYRHHRDHIVRLMRPSDTTMDLSIASAFWFAARGKGVVDRGDGQEEYQSSARVLLLGSGADELLGGYSRHYEAYRDNSWAGLIREFQIDIDRLPSRNLGRDDRVIADHGRESRLPFLAAPVQTFLAQVPVWYKSDPRCERGVGEKLLLRVVARKLGFSNETVLRAKRAVQFGARTARLDDVQGSGRRAHGTDKVTAH